MHHVVIVVGLVCCLVGEGVAVFESYKDFGWDYCKFLDEYLLGKEQRGTSGMYIVVFLGILRKVYLFIPHRTWMYICFSW